MTREHQQEQVRQSAERLGLDDRTQLHGLADIQAMMTETAQRAVDGTLQGLGIDAQNPLQAQQDFAKLRSMRKLMEDENFVADLAFIRRLRVNSQKISDTGLRTVVRWLLVGALGLIVLITRDYWISHFKG